MLRAFTATVAAAVLVGTLGAVSILRAHSAQPVASSQLRSVVSNRTILTTAQRFEAQSSGTFDGPVTSILNFPGRLRYGQFVWNDEGVPSGRVWVRIDVTSQMISVFRSGEEIGTAVILYGATDKETPLGRFPVLAKYEDHRSSTYDSAPMPYTLRLTPDGVSIHGSDVRWGRATHGCIGVPVAFAKLLFAQVKKGDDVLILKGPGVPA